MKLREVSDSRLFRGFGRKIDEEGKWGCNYARIRGALSTVITKNLAFINISEFFFGCILGRLAEKIIFVKDFKEILGKNIY
jgi:hypothetical protein